MTVFASLRARIYALAALLGLAALSLGLLLFQSSAQSRDAFRWVNHSQEVITDLDTLLADVREAESGLRGYLLTGNRTYLQPVEPDAGRAINLAARVRDMVRDNPPQAARADRLKELVAKRVAVIRHATANAGDLGHADPNLVAHAKKVMDDLSALVGAMRANERGLLGIRGAWVENNAEQARLLLFVGWPVLALFIAGAVWLILVSINRPLEDLLTAVNRFGAGDRRARAAVEGRSVEFKALAAAYNSMADTLVDAMDRQSRAEGEVARTNAELLNRSRELESRSHSIALISGMAQRLQAIHSEHEFVEVLACFLPQVLPDLAGSLYVHNSSRNLLTRTVTWGEPQASPEFFAPEGCWGLRRGKEHVVDRPGTDLVCQHAAGALPVTRRCEPVLAGGEVIGLLYLEGPTSSETLFRIGLVVENISLALVNEMLRKRLREQSIRDPLTGLFNRRYMEEALTLEAARAVRGRNPMALIMCDVDHFKRFNDSHGHEAGDALLRAVAAQIQSHFRDGDIVCRYGGEEFMVIAPGTALGPIRQRVDGLRRSVRELTIEFRGQRLGPVTMSFGMDGWDENSPIRPEEMVSRADQALYRAKRLGRDRIELAVEQLQTAAE
jgi:diguanylate cyclase (GGDEF)-like protein